MASFTLPRLVVPGTFDFFSRRGDMGPQPDGGWWLCIVQPTVARPAVIMGQGLGARVLAWSCNDNRPYWREL